MANPFKKICDELPASTVRILEGILLLALGGLLSLIFGKELRELIAHRIFVFFSAITQILAIFPRLLYLSAFLIFLVLSITLWIKLKRERIPKEKISTSYTLGETQVILFYNNPDHCPNLTPYQIANDIEAKVYCLKCNSEILPKDNEIRCNCPNIHRAKDSLLYYKETARQHLIESLKANLSK